ncbi:hypothetical protein H4R18_002135 [Coemansia javaensis]|uniref:Uncharacterized protein n=1 Tax=Coemansia javaensis TaxID=2761396 RepID=A0A9W8HHL2_9FUNG|nr:hypothetical protein H4R18_002135 [Coemansia javaensis]
MVRITAFAAAAAAIAAVASGQQCTGNTSKCPGADGVSPTYLQCNSWNGQYVSMNCPSGQVCYTNPNAPTTAMCGLPGTGGQGQCTGNTAKCVSPGQSGDYLQCENWSGKYVSASCPSGLKCYTSAGGNGVFCN